MSTLHIDLSQFTLSSNEQISTAFTIIPVTITVIWYLKLNIHYIRRVHWTETEQTTRNVCNYKRDCYCNDGKITLCIYTQTHGRICYVDVDRDVVLQTHPCATQCRKKRRKRHREWVEESQCNVPIYTKDRRSLYYGMVRAPSGTRLASLLYLAHIALLQLKCVWNTTNLSTLSRLFRCLQIYGRR